MIVFNKFPYLHFYMVYKINLIITVIISPLLNTFYFFIININIHLHVFIIYIIYFLSLIYAMYRTYKWWSSFKLAWYSLFLFSNSQTFFALRKFFSLINSSIVTSCICSPLSSLTSYLKYLTMALCLLKSFLCFFLFVSLIFVSYFM